MTKRKTLVVATAGLAAVIAATTASGGPLATKQRVAIDGRLHLATGKGTWTLVPLSPGPLKRDAGTLVGGGVIKPPRVKANGQRVTVVVGKDSHTGRNGTFVITQLVETIVVSDYSPASGTWVFRAGTGSYVGVRGGGAFAAVGLTNSGVLYMRQEGYLSKG